jgi:dTMP kinase
VDRLCARLTAHGISHVRTREPGGTPIGDAIRALLLDPDSRMTPVTEAYLYAASRAEHVRKVIVPALNDRRVVVCDRFVDASVAYQGYGLEDPELAPQAIMDVNELALAGILPHLTIVLDLPVWLAQARMQVSNRDGLAGADRIERRGAAFFERVRSGLRERCEQMPQRFSIVDAGQDAAVVEQAVWTVAMRAISGRGAQV